MNKSIKGLISKIKSTHLDICQRVGAIAAAPTEKQARAALFILGVAVLSLGLSHEVIAQGIGAGKTTTTYNDVKIANAVNAIMAYLEGSFGALVMAAAGIGAILSASFGQFKAALSLMVVAVGAFILRSLMSTFFNDVGIRQ
jgi:hypothetical protein